MDCMDGMDGAKRVVGLPPAPLKRGNRKATRNLGPAGPAPKGRYSINRRSRPTAAPRQASVR